MEYSVVITGLNKDIRGVRILEDINLQLAPGKIYGFVGKNGAGKTMLFRAICGLIRPSSGRVEVYGKEVGKDGTFPPGVGILLEKAGFWDHYTGLENLKALASIRKKIGEEKIRKTLEAIGLDPDDQRNYNKYSLGMKQRLAIAQAFMEDPDLLVLDEPSSALDQDGVKQLHHLLLGARERNATILIATHIASDIETLCDEVFRMEEGRISHDRKNR